MLPAPGHLVDGIVVEGKIVASLFGVNLLRVRADVVLVPADVRRTGDTDCGRQPVGGRVPDVTTAAANGDATLADALRLVREADHSLRRMARGSAVS